jgi:hypothetical protein
MLKGANNIYRHEGKVARRWFLTSTFLAFDPNTR